MTVHARTKLELAGEEWGEPQRFLLSRPTVREAAWAPRYTLNLRKDMGRLDPHLRDRVRSMDLHVV